MLKMTFYIDFYQLNNNYRFTEIQKYLDIFLLLPNCTCTSKFQLGAFVVSQQLRGEKWHIHPAT